MTDRNDEPAVTQAERLRWQLDCTEQALRETATSAEYGWKLARIASDAYDRERALRLAAEKKLAKAAKAIKGASQ